DLGAPPWARQHGCRRSPVRGADRPSRALGAAVPAGLRGCAAGAARATSRPVGHRPSARSCCSRGRAADPAGRRRSRRRPGRPSPP
ncbi:MAG: hypothetical protein AVDCRST_MAG48-2603, partial [uncultured Friedmanniella sp.]